MSSFVFFGTDTFALVFLEALKEKGLAPKLIVCGEDKPQDRGLTLTPPPVKVWAEKNNIPFIQPGKLDASINEKLKGMASEFFLVASYGKIIPKTILDIPPKGTLNIHPSLLPHLRGSSPIQNLILQEEIPGITIIKLDEQVDHGPMLAQKELKVDTWPMLASVLLPRLATLGAEVLKEILPDFLTGKIQEKAQDDRKATFTKKIKKEDALIDLKSNPWDNYKKILAYDIWPRAYFFRTKKGKQIRVVVIEAEFKNKELHLLKVIPEGKKEMSYEIFLKSLS